MTDQEFIYKLQNVLIAMADIWYEPQWEQLSQQLLDENYGYVDLDNAQIAFAHAESLLNPTEGMTTIVKRVEQWKQERENN